MLIRKNLSKSCYIKAKDYISDRSRWTQNRSFADSEGNTIGDLTARSSEISRCCAYGALKLLCNEMNLAEGLLAAELEIAAQELFSRPATHVNDGIKGGSERISPVEAHVQILQVFDRAIEIAEEN